MVITLVSLAIVPAAAVYLYQQWGAMEEVAQYRAMQEMTAASDRAEQMAALTAQLGRGEDKPENTEGWPCWAWLHASGTVRRCGLGL